MPQVKINFMKAREGDSILIEFGDNMSLLVDGGLKRTMKENISIVQPVLERCSNNILLVTHIDDDHIAGISYLFECEKELVRNFSTVLFNHSSDLKKFAVNCQDPPPEIRLTDSALVGLSTAKKFEDCLANFNIPLYSNLVAGTSFDLADLNIQVLSPSCKSLEKYSQWYESKAVPTACTSDDYEKSFDELAQNKVTVDNSPTNCSSISIIVQYLDNKLLLLGDSLPNDIEKTLAELGYTAENKLKVDVVKVSHHGSKNNTTSALLDRIQCPRFLISTDGTHNGHPSKECLVKIIRSQNNPQLLFNYPPLKEIFSEEEIKRERFSTNITNEVYL